MTTVVSKDGTSIGYDRRAEDPPMIVVDGPCATESHRNDEAHPVDTRSVQA
jgi:hypothetical protein